MSRIVSFRGLIADGEQETIHLHTNDGSTGYRITKFQLMAKTPGVANYEHIVKIYKTEQSSVDAIIDFSDNRLLAGGFLEGSDDNAYSDGIIVVFDNEVFNQDIYITHSEVKLANECNYYIELEQVSLDLNENTVATLKDIRNVA